MIHRGVQTAGETGRAEWPTWMTISIRYVGNNKHNMPITYNQIPPFTCVLMGPWLQHKT